MKIAKARTRRQLVFLSLGIKFIIFLFLNDNMPKTLKFTPAILHEEAITTPIGAFEAIPAPLEVGFIDDPTVGIHCYCKKFAKTYLVKKGENKGKAFWTCQETDPDATNKCGFFLWDNEALFWREIYNACQYSNVQFSDELVHHPQEIKRSTQFRDRYSKKFQIRDVNSKVKRFTIMLVLSDEAAKYLTCQLKDNTVTIFQAVTTKLNAKKAHVYETAVEPEMLA